MARPRTGEELEILHTGLTVAEMAIVFNLTQREIKEKVVGKVKPATPLHRTPVRYAISDVAPLLVKVEVNIEEALKSISPSKLPPMLQDAFWKAQRNRLAFMEEQKQLWSSDRVIEIIGDMIKPIRMQILMFQQHVAERAELSEEQRAIIQELSDGLLQRTYHELDKVMAMRPVAADEHGPPLAEAEAMAEMEKLETQSDEDDDDWLE